MPSLRRRRPPRPADGSMTLMEHLYELRHRLFLSVLVILLGSIVGFIWFSVGIPALRIPPLVDILTGPYCQVPSPPRVEDKSGVCQLLATGPFSILQLRLTAAIMAGAVLSCPLWLYQLWAYVGPALYSKEKKFALSFTGIGAGLFAGGMVLAYFVIPEALKVLLGFGGHDVAAWLDAQLYFKFLIGMMLIFGVSLELPLLLVMLNFAGVIKGVKLAQARRYACFGLVVFAGIAVPGNDPISMGVLALVLCILYEVAVQVSKSHDKRKLARQTAAEAALSDDAAAPLGDDVASDLTADDLSVDGAGDTLASGPIAPAEPIGAASGTGPENDPPPAPANWTDVT